MSPRELEIGGADGRVACEREVGGIREGVEAPEGKIKERPEEDLREVPKNEGENDERARCRERSDVRPAGLPVASTDAGTGNERVGQEHLYGELYEHRSGEDGDPARP